MATPPGFDPNVLVSNAPEASSDQAEELHPKKNPPLTHQQEGKAADRFDGTHRQRDFANKMVLEKRTPEARNLSNLASREVMRKPQALPEHYRQVVKDPLLHDPAHQTLSQDLQSRSLGNQPGLNKGMLSQLFRLRHFFQDKPITVLILKEEIALAREAKTQEGSIVERGGAENFPEGLNQQTLSLLQKVEASINKQSLEGLLKRLFAGEEIIPMNTSARFGLTAKTPEGWKTFFLNILTKGSAEQMVSKNLQSLVDALFRGLYKATQAGMTLVTDLRFQDGEKVLSEKFARVLVENPDVLLALEKLQPGETLAPDILAKLGDELLFLKLAHVPAEAGTQSALSLVKGQANKEAREKLEQNLVHERKKRLLAGLKGKNEDPLDQKYGTPLGAGSFIDEDQKLKRRSFIQFILTLLGLTLTGFLIYLLFQNLK